MNLSGTLPRLLLVEDDAVSRVFLTEALLALPAVVDAVDSIAAARLRTESETHDLWLIDAGLPDGDGIDCLTALRQRRAAASALAITAEAFHERIECLRAAGFEEVLQKPISVAALQSAVRRVLGGSRALDADPLHEASPLWDQTQALAAAGGRKETLVALRALFLEELPRQRRYIDEAVVCGDVDAIRSTLHKLKASCGFVGAGRLLDAVRMLSTEPTDTEALRRFRLCVDRQLAGAESF